MPSSSANRPVVALTVGDPGGIGLELALAAWHELGPENPFVLIADRKHVLAIEGHPDIVDVTSPRSAGNAMVKGLPLHHVDFGSPARAGVSSDRHHEGIRMALVIATGWAVAGDVDAICTNPAPKSAFGTARPGAGHTEWLAGELGCEFPVMMLVNASLRVITVTRHVPLVEVPSRISGELVMKTVLECDRALRQDFGIDDPSIGVTGLNPHAGEGGMLGEEEARIISPVINELEARGLKVSGPLPADSAFGYRRRRQFDAMVCMYHDQALIPVKTLDNDDTVNVTLGLPIIRTSPGHGTALDMAGAGTADCGSLVAAIRLAGEMRHNRILRDLNASRTAATT